MRVIKFSPEDQEMFAYDARLIVEDNGTRLLEGWFEVADRQLDQVTFCRGDRFIERYYSDRWYNIYEVHDQDSERVKAWYCNISQPAYFTPTEIHWVDMALDVLIYPDRSVKLLDQDEFASLKLDKTTRIKCWLAVEELIALAKTKELPVKECFHITE